APPTVAGGPARPPPVLLGQLHRRWRSRPHASLAFRTYMVARSSTTCASWPRDALEFVLPPSAISDSTRRPFSMTICADEAHPEPDEPPGAVNETGCAAQRSLGAALKTTRSRKAGTIAISYFVSRLKQHVLPSCPGLSRSRPRRTHGLDEVPYPAITAEARMPVDSTPRRSDSVSINALAIVSTLLVLSGPAPFAEPSTTPEMFESPADRILRLAQEYEGRRDRQLRAGLTD